MLYQDFFFISGVSELDYREVGTGKTSLGSGGVCRALSTMSCLMKYYSMGGQYMDIPLH